MMVSSASSRGGQFVDCLTDAGGRDHQAHDARGTEVLDELDERRGSGCALLRKRFHRLRRVIVDDACVPAPHEPPHHVGAHSP